MFSTERFLIGQDGSWHMFPFDNRLFRMLPANLPENYEFVLYAIKESGYVSLKMMSREIRIVFNPLICKRSTAEDVINCIAVGNPMANIVVTAWINGWMNYSFENAWKTMEGLDLIWSDAELERKSSEFVIKARRVQDIQKLEINTPLLDAVQVWNASGRTLNDRSVDALTKATKNRLFVGESSPAELRIVEFRNAYTFKSRAKNMTVRDRNVDIKEILLDPNYANWSRESYWNFQNSNDDIRFEEIDARINFSGDGREWERRRYRRALMKGRTQEGRPVVISTSVVDNAIAIA